LALQDQEGVELDCTAQGSSVNTHTHQLHKLISEMPAVETFKNIPELFEGTFEESIKVRTETLSNKKSLEFKG
jgi:hypothetical protein